MSQQLPQKGILLIYTINYCPYCLRAKEFLTRKNIPFIEVDVTDNQSLRENLVEMTGGRKTVPQIFIGLRSIGGYDNLMELEKTSKFDMLLKESEIGPT